MYTSTNKVDTSAVDFFELLNTRAYLLCLAWLSTMEELFPNGQVGKPVLGLLRRLHSICIYKVCQLHSQSWSPKSAENHRPWKGRLHLAMTTLSGSTEYAPVEIVWSSLNFANTNASRVCRANRLLLPRGHHRSNYCCCGGPSNSKSGIDADRSWLWKSRHRGNQS